MPRPKLRTTDRLLWVGLARVWAGWRQSLVIVRPDTVLRWQRRRFRQYWTSLSSRSSVGRPRVNAEVRALVTRMARANPLWGAPRIHGELMQLGIDVAERAVSRLIPKRPTPPSPDLARVPHEPCPGPGLDRLLHRSHCSAAGALCPGCPRSPSASGPALQHRRASHR